VEYLQAAHYSKVADRDWRWPSFSPREMACKGTGEVKLHRDTMDKLQSLRDRLGVPMLITSAYRSPSHNAKVGGAKNSVHMQGRAFDVRMDNHDPKSFESVARECGFTGFGHYPKSGFMHIDTGPARSWGTEWPRSVNRLPVEPPIVPETVREDPVAQAAAGAGGAGVLAVAMDALPAVSGLMGNVAPVVQGILAAGALVLVAYIVWRRVR